MAAGKMTEVSENRINRVIDHIQANLDAPLSIGQLSKVACYSEFHFNRIFKKTMGESVYKFIRRLRLEKAAEQLLVKPGTSITEIALSCGFASSSSFAKSFKNHFKMNATEWRYNFNTFFSKDSEPVQIEQGRISFIKGSPVWTFNRNGLIRQVVVETISPFTIAYIRNVGPYQGDEPLFDKLVAQLFRWAVPHGIVDEDTRTLNLYYDNPEITEKQKLRVMVAIPVEDSVCPSGSVGVTRVSGGKYGVCRFLLKKNEFMEAWDWMFSAWLGTSGYERGDREAFERCLGEKYIDGTRYFDVEICIPVKAKS
jgi:AraC family transcriptional regulator